MALRLRVSDHDVMDKPVLAAPLTLCVRWRVTILCGARSCGMVRRYRALGRERCAPLNGQLNSGASASHRRTPSKAGGPAFVLCSARNVWLQGMDDSVA